MTTAVFADAAGLRGVPEALIDALYDHAVNDLRVVSNNRGTDDRAASVSCSPPVASVA